MPRLPKRRKRVSRKGTVTGPDTTPERHEIAGKWYYDNVAAEGRHPTPDFPDRSLIWTMALPAFTHAAASTLRAWYRLTGALPIARRCYKVWEETQDLTAVHREAVTAAAGTGYHSTGEVAAALESLPNDNVERRKFYQRMADESHNAGRARRARSTAWDQLASSVSQDHLGREVPWDSEGSIVQAVSSASENPLIREMNLMSALLTLLWTNGGLWLCDTPTIEGFLTEFFGRAGLRSEVTERQITDEIRCLGLHRYEGKGRLILANRGPEPDAQLREEMRALITEGTVLRMDGSSAGKKSVERIQYELENSYKLLQEGHFEI